MSPKVYAKIIAQIDFRHYGLDALLGRQILMPVDNFGLADFHDVLLSLGVRFTEVTASRDRAPKSRRSRQDCQNALAIAKVLPLQSLPLYH